MSALTMRTAHGQPGSGPETGRQGVLTGDPWFVGENSPEEPGTQLPLLKGLVRIVLLSH